MAATVSSPWAKPGAWALDAEEHEEELRQQPSDSQNNSDSGSGESEFPSLAAAAATKVSKKKKKTVSLAEFTTKTFQPIQPSRGITHEDLVNLPTGPRQRSAEELDRSRLGGGFKSYGISNRNGDDSSNSRWGGANSRVSGRDRDASREFTPSRADDVDDWSKTKKTPSGNGYDRKERGSFFDSQSKADEVDNWAANKPTESRRFGATNGGFERRGSFDSLSRDRHGSYGASGGSGSDNWGRKREEISETVGARPKLVLQPRTVPVNNDNGTAGKPKGSNPFGDARPREQVLAEKGEDWKKIDEKLESVKIDGNKDAEKGRRGFGRGGSGNERSWRKPDSVDSNSQPQSSEKIGDGSEYGHQATEDGISEEN